MERLNNMDLATRYSENTRKKYCTKYTSLSGGFSSAKNEEIVWFESSLERDFAILMEFNPLVSHYIEQPFSINYYVNGLERTYTPDFIVHFFEERNPWLCEIKPKDILLKNEEKFKVKFDAAKQFCQIEKLDFKIFTEEHIRSPYLENIKFLSNYELLFASDQCLDLVSERLKVLGNTTIKELLFTLDDANQQIKAKCIYALWCLVKNNEVSCDLSLKITVESEIWLNNEK